ncbi:hypothetical protein L210DRAFT_951551 [Boletus edulis BED1]|uniref:Secreted protein n=1 Tax=Boletus edulis BED1 TaxID=1328754 RepID=A0AAD4GES9_BOLED|nr:hypothetical protein L210DRAFT_951551 [Boletus edulis BED1]
MWTLVWVMICLRLALGQARVGKWRKVAQAPFFRATSRTRWLIEYVAQLALEFLPTHRTLVILPGGRAPPRFPLGSIEPWRGVRGILHWRRSKFR